MGPKDKLALSIYKQIVVDLDTKRNKEETKAHDFKSRLESDK